MTIKAASVHLPIDADSTYNERLLVTTLFRPANKETEVQAEVNV